MWLRDEKASSIVLENSDLILKGREQWKVISQGRLQFCVEVLLLRQLGSFLNDWFSSVFEPHLNDLSKVKVDPPSQRCSVAG